MRLENPPYSNSPTLVILSYSQYDFDMYRFHLNVTSTKNRNCLWLAIQYFFISRKSHVYSWDIPSISWVVASWWILVHEVENISKNFCGTVNHFVMKLGRLIAQYLELMGNITRNVFTWFKVLDPKSRPVLVYQSTKTNQKPTMMRVCFYSFESVHRDARKL